MDQQQQARIEKVLGTDPMPEEALRDVRNFQAVADTFGDELLQDYATQLNRLADEVYRLRENPAAGTFGSSAIAGCAKVFKRLYESSDLAGDSFMRAIAVRGHNLCREIFRLHLEDEAKEN